MRPPLCQLSYTATRSRGAREDSRKAEGMIAAMAETSEEESQQGPVCGKCERVCEPLELEACPICKVTFCSYCAYRVGSRNYCSRPCGDSFFFGSDADADDDLPEE